MAVRLLSGKNILIAIVLIIAFSVAMFAPLRREYTSSFDRQTGAASILTDAHYGAPFVWLTLSKEEDAHNPDHVYSQARQQDNKKFIYDTAFWVAALSIGGVLSHYTDTSSLVISQMKGRRRF